MKKRLLALLLVMGVSSGLYCMSEVETEEGQKQTEITEEEKVVYPVNVDPVVEDGIWNGVREKMGQALGFGSKTWGDYAPNFIQYEVKHQAKRAVEFKDAHPYLSKGAIALFIAWLINSGSLQVEKWASEERCDTIGRLRSAWRGLYTLGVLGDKGEDGFGRTIKDEMEAGNTLLVIRTGIEATGAAGFVLAGVVHFGGRIFRKYFPVDKMKEYLKEARKYNPNNGPPQNEGE